MQIKPFKIRASKLSVIMTSPNDPELSVGAKTYCEEWLISQVYQKEKEIKSKYLTKGNECEQLGIDRYNRTFGTFCVKNETFFEDDWITGTPDIVEPDRIIDIKASWDCWTFPLLETEITNKAYYWQLQAYMYMLGKSKAELVYCLENYIDEYGNVYNYDDVEDKHRIKVFKLDYDPEVIAKAKEKVNACREYIEILKTKL